MLEPILFQTFILKKLLDYNKGKSIKIYNSTLQYVFWPTDCLGQLPSAIQGGEEGRGPVSAEALEEEVDGLKAFPHSDRRAPKGHAPHNVLLKVSCDLLSCQEIAETLFFVLWSGQEGVRINYQVIRLFRFQWLKQSS